MLHDIPPPGSDRSDGPLRNRRGYRALHTVSEVEEEQYANNEAQPSTEPEDAEEEREEQLEEREAIRKDGWTALGQSFFASASMTVCSIFLYLDATMS